MRRILFVGLFILCLNLLCHAAEPTITIQVNDKATGDPIPQASIEAGQDKTTTDDYGQCTLTMQQQRGYFSIHVSKDGYASQAIRWQNMHADQKLPQQLTFNLEPGMSIGGKVVDETGKPVAGAIVHLLTFDNGETDGKITSSIRANPKTDDKGMWSTNAAPGDLSNVDYLIEASGYFNGNVYKNAPPAEKLRDRSAVMTVQHAAQVSGRVTGPDGKPVAKAEITSGEEGWYGAQHMTFTDANGEFTLSGIRPGAVRFAVQGDNYAADLASAIAPTTQPVGVQLAAGKGMKIHVVDSAGKPIARVKISTDQWRYVSFLEHTMFTNANGDAVWLGAPADEVQMNFTKRGLGSVRDKPITATTQTTTVTLGPRTQVHGMVTDATTGEPIKDFKIIIGIYWRNSDAPNWMSAENGEQFAPRDGHDGKLDFDVGNGEVFQQYPHYALRVAAPGYLPCDSRRFEGDDGAIALDFKMVKGAWISGTLFGTDHKPLANTEVDLIAGQKSMQVQDHGQIARWGREQSETMQTDAQGHFAFSPQGDAFILLCMNDNGYAEIDAPALHPQPLPAGWSAPEEPIPTTRPSSYDLNLQAWANVQGKLMIGSKPGAHREVGLQNQRGPWHPGEPQVWFNYSATTDSEGNFGFDHVPPMDIHVDQPIRVERMTSYSHVISITPKPGEIVSLQIGGTGRPVAGKLSLPADWKAGNWFAMNPNLYPHRDLPKAPSMPLGVRLGSDEAKQKWRAEWMKTDEGKKYMAEQQTRAMKVLTDYALVIQADGSFRAEDVPAGTYDLNAQFYPAAAIQNGGWGRPLATAHKTITIAPIAGGRSDEPMDIGVVPVVTGPPSMEE